MTYILALALSVMVCAMTVALSLVQRNTEHIQHGREPLASFSLFPMVPLFQALALGLAWVFERTLPHLAVSALCLIFAVLAALWLWSFIRAKFAYSQARQSAQGLTPP
jgi:hypothetical protein